MAKVKRMDDQEERLDTIVNVLGRLKEENDSRHGTKFLFLKNFLLKSYLGICRQV